MAKIFVDEAPASVPVDAGRYRVEWRDYDGITRDRRFKSRPAAERFAFQVEEELCAQLIGALCDMHDSAKSGTDRCQADPSNATVSKRRQG
jgi:hypothetical protein